MRKLADRLRGHESGYQQFLIAREWAGITFEPTSDELNRYVRGLPFAVFAVEDRSVRLLSGSWSLLEMLDNGIVGENQVRAVLLGWPQPKGPVVPTDELVRAARFGWEHRAA